MQLVPLHDGLGITVTAYAAGHTLGGAVWKVHKEAEDVVYAVDYNHRKEKHLNGRGEHFSPRYVAANTYSSDDSQPV
jgi:Cft2 family RNA processing exonuclease